MRYLDWLNSLFSFGSQHDPHQGHWRDDAWPDESFATTTINPATGLMMCGSLDAAGKLYGCSGSSLFDDPICGLSSSLFDDSGCDLSSSLFDDWGSSLGSSFEDW